MRRCNAFFILLFALFCFACAGGNSAKKIPEHITAGTKEMAGGIARYNKGCYQDSLEYFFKAHELFVASDQLSGVAMSLNNIGNVYRVTGDFDSALLFLMRHLQYTLIWVTPWAGCRCYLTKLPHS